MNTEKSELTLDEPDQVAGGDLGGISTDAVYCLAAGAIPVVGVLFARLQKNLADRVSAFQSGG